MEKVKITSGMMRDAIVNGNISYHKGMHTICMMPINNYEEVKERTYLNGDKLIRFIDAGKANVITSHEYATDKEAEAQLVTHTLKPSIVGGILDCINNRINKGE